MSDIEELLNRKYSPLVTKIIMKSWRPSTCKQYEVYIGKWKLFCAVKSLDFRVASVEHVLDFLAELHRQGHRYSSIARWLCVILDRAGIDTRKFRAHSTRAASTSHAANIGVPMDDIMRLAGWSTAGTFQKYYQKPIQQNVFATKLLA